jgi:hypothetical protein
MPAFNHELSERHLRSETFASADVSRKFSCVELNDSPATQNRTTQSNSLFYSALQKHPLVRRLLLPHREQQGYGC